MLGTIVNTSTIILGSLIGATLKRGIRPQYQEVVFIALGVCSIALGLNAFVHFMPKSHYPVLFILSMAIGGVVGAMLKLSERFNRLVDRKRKANDDSPRLSEGLSTAILLFCDLDGAECHLRLWYNVGSSCIVLLARHVLPYRQNIGFCHK